MTKVLDHQLREGKRHLHATCTTLVSGSARLRDSTSGIPRTHRLQLSALVFSPADRRRKTADGGRPPTGEAGREEGREVSTSCQR
eukprot:scaffold7362_cov266-Pinguiococcus_pyrenoidosus.AAC.22